MKLYTTLTRKMTRTAISLIVILALVTSFLPLPGTSYAQSTQLPSVGTMVGLSPAYNPVMVHGITVYPDNPLKFDFIVDAGDDNLQGDALRETSRKLIKYFLASLTVPEDELWVNLSPYEKDRIIAPGLGKTEMGKDLLAQDYMLKQLMSSLMYPEKEIGKAFWQRVQTKAKEKYPNTPIPTDVFNKVWIIPEKAVVYAEGTSVYVIESRLKVMLEQDYLALESNSGNTKHGLGNIQKDDLEVINNATAEVIREILIPEIEKEVNEGTTFASLRQIYHAMILATWFKQNLKDSPLGQLYVDQNKLGGIDLKEEGVTEKIYNQYLEAFKVGAYDLIKEDYDAQTQQVTPRRYFSGGYAYNGDVVEEAAGDPAMLVRSALMTTISTVLSLCTGGCDTQLPTNIENDPVVEEVRDTVPDGTFHMVGLLPEPGDNWWPIISPETIGIDHKGDIYVLDSGSAPLMKFGANEQLIYENFSGEIRNGRKIVFDSQNNFYIPQVNTVKKFSEDGTYIGEIEINVPNQEETPSVLNVAIDPDNNLYVVDTNSFSIHKFDAQGNYLFSWGGQGLGEGQFDSRSRKIDIATDSQGFIYVADNHNTRIQKFDSKGKFIKQWGTGFPNFSQLVTDSHYTGAFAIDSSDIIYIGHEGIGEDNQDMGLKKFDTDGLPIAFSDGAFTLIQFDVGPINITQEGDIYMVFGIQRAIGKINPEGTLLKTFSILSEVPNSPHWLTGSTVSQDGMIYIGDEQERIQIYDSSLNFIKTLHLPKEEFSFNPLGGMVIAANPNQGSIYVAQQKLMFKLDSQGSKLAEWNLDSPVRNLFLNSKNELLLFLRDGRVLTMDQNSGNVISEMNPELPFSFKTIVLDKNDNIYVAAEEGIIKLDPAGQLIKEWPYRVRMNSSIHYGSDIEDIAVDFYGYVYALFAGGDVQVFDSEGNLVNHWSLKEGVRPGELLFTGGTWLEVAPSGDVYIIEHGGSRLQIFRESDNAMLQSNPGGIDLNPNNATIETQGSLGPIDFAPSNIQNIKFDGILFNITNIVPAANLSPILE